MDTQAAAWVESQGLTKTCPDRQDGPGAVLSETVATVSLSAAPGPSRLFRGVISFLFELVMSCKIVGFHYPLPSLSETGTGTG